MHTDTAQHLTFQGILFLYNDIGLVTQQLDGRPCRAFKAELRHDVSTDEITPARILSHYDATLSRFVYTGLQVENEFPFSEGSMQSLGVQVVVAGQRYGKGSSREHSPAAEMHAGVRLVIAESFERIYRQNADNIGLFTSTDFGLIERIQRREPIPLSELTTGRDNLAQAILGSGGLLQYGQEHLSGVDVGDINTGHDKPMTLFEKIVSRHLLHTQHTPASLDKGNGVFVRADWRFIHEYYTAMCAHMLHTRLHDPVQLKDPERIVVFEDHTSYMHESPAHVQGGLIPNMMAMVRAQREFAKQYGLNTHRTLTDQEALLDDGSNSAGISHAMMAEHYVLPGQLVAGTDSHTPHSGALGCVAFGVGTTDMANAFITGAVRMTIPEVLKIELNGVLPDGITAKDVVLHLLSQDTMKSGYGLGKVFEFAGPVVEAFSIDERATLTNMVAELGGFTGIVAPDAKTVAFIKERRGTEITLEPWMSSDVDARYADVITVDCSALSSIVARPGDPGNGIPLGQLTERPEIDIAYGGSCTGGKRADFDMYYEVLAWADRHGKSLAPGVQLHLQYGTTAVRDYCIEQGYDELFKRMNARILQPSCGACANCGPGVSEDKNQITISAINRNFPGRSGPGSVWLASPPTVAASAIAGKIVSFDELRLATN